MPFSIVSIIEEVVVGFSYLYLIISFLASLASRVFMVQFTGMKITYFYNEEWEKDYITEHLPGQEITFLSGTTNDHKNLQDTGAEIVSIFVNSPCGKAEMSMFPNLKHIATRSTGFDHIDCAEAKSRGITVSYVPGYGENTVAEFAMGLLLTVSRRLYECINRVQVEGLFSPEGLRGFDLKGKTLGVLGTGRIGSHVIRMAKGFEMTVVAFDPFPKETLAKELGFTYMTLDEVLTQADVVSVHFPYMPETYHILNKSNIMKMKKGSVLINTARGALVETEAIVQALRDGVLAGVGLDVLEEEGFIQDETKTLLEGHPNEAALKVMLENHYLIEHPRVVITPHNAFNTGEAVKRILDTTIENILAFGRGEKKNLVP